MKIRLKNNKPNRISTKGINQKSLEITYRLLSSEGRNALHLTIYKHKLAVSR